MKYQRLKRSEWMLPDRDLSSPVVVESAHGLSRRSQRVQVGAVLVGLHDLRYWRNPAKRRMHWFFEHMGGMIGSSVGALTAFSALGGRRFGLEPFGILSWVLPSLVMSAVAMLWIGYYKRRMSTSLHASPAHYEKVFGARNRPSQSAIGSWS